MRNTTASDSGVVPVRQFYLMALSLHCRSYLLRLGVPLVDYLRPAVCTGTPRRCRVSLLHKDLAVGYDVSRPPYWLYVASMEAPVLVVLVPHARMRFPARLLRGHPSKA